MIGPRDESDPWKEFWVRWGRVPGSRDPREPGEWHRATVYVVRDSMQAVVDGLGDRHLMQRRPVAEVRSLCGEEHVGQDVEYRDGRPTEGRFCGRCGS